MTSSGRSDPIDVYRAGLSAQQAAELVRLRALITAAAASSGVGPLVAALKWGEPSYTPAKSGIGSSVRLAALADGGVAMHFICHTGLVDRFREVYPDRFDYAGNRSILIAPGAATDDAALSHCIAMALTYHRDRKAGVR